MACAQRPEQKGIRLFYDPVLLLGPFQKVPSHGLQDVVANVFRVTGIHHHLGSRLAVFHLYQIHREVEGTKEVKQLFPVGIFAHGRDQLGRKPQLVQVEGYIHGRTTRHSAIG